MKNKNNAGLQNLLEVCIDKANSLNSSNHCIDCEHFSSDNEGNYNCYHGMLKNIKEFNLDGESSMFLVSEKEIRENGWLFARPRNCPVNIVTNILIDLVNEIKNGGDPTSDSNIGKYLDKTFKERFNNGKVKQKIKRVR